ncbi:MAG: NAD(P)/FAD-dependent oxidoreductase [Candidatus Berkiella sp.]
MQQTDVLIIGAGAAGLMCAIESAKRHRKVVVIEHANKPGKKILMSGGGRCNFTNLHVSPEKYLSNNRHFCKSALSRYTQWDFIALVKKHHIAYHEKTLGQLFCDDKAKDIVNMLLKECNDHGAIISLDEKILSIEKKADYQYIVTTSVRKFHTQSLVVACGGLSIPTMGASALGYEIAKQFNISVWPTRASLVPLTLHEPDKIKFSPLAGIANDCIVSAGKTQFRENMLFTHRGLSGPAILQISNYWQPGEMVDINLLPDLSLLEWLKSAQERHPKRSLKEALTEHFSKRVITTFLDPSVALQPLQSLSHKKLAEIANIFQNWCILPNGTEGYRTAEVTLGGIDTTLLSSKTMEANQVKGLYFIGEVVDVTGWLGGYNFQWAWSSGWAAGQVA